MNGTPLSPEETEVIIDYARRKYGLERWPLSTELRPIREALAKPDPKPEPISAAMPRPYVPSSLTKRKRRR